MSSSNCCILTWIQISQEADQEVWYSHLFKNFPQFVVIHTVKGFGRVNKAEIDDFLELSCFFDDPMDAAIWSVVPLPFLKPAWTSESSWFTYCWSLAWRILSIALLVCEMSTLVQQFEQSLALPFLGIGMKTDLFQSCGHCWVFQICWHIECRTFTASSFRIWNSSSGIPSPLLALFIVMLHSPGCLVLGKWSHHSDYLGHEDFFVYSFSVYSWYLFLMSSASVRSISFLSFIEPIFAWNVPLVSLVFLKRSLVFPILLFPSISLHWSLRKPFSSLLAILWNSALKWLYLSFSPLPFTSLLFAAICQWFLTTLWFWGFTQLWAGCLYQSLCKQYQPNFGEGWLFSLKNYLAGLRIISSWIGS